MDLSAKLQRSHNPQEVDFSVYQSAQIDDPLIEVTNTNTVHIEPYWKLDNDWEGKHYRHYIASHPEYIGVYARSEAVQRLYTAASLLKPHLRLVVRAGHRPLEVQRALLAECIERYRQDHPEASRSQALEHARQFVSDPDIVLPPHVCGSAFDVELLDSTTGQLLDFGSRVNDDNATSFLYYPNLTQLQKDNRQILLAAMLEAGFASRSTEWWHFSYGDQVWAWFYSQPQSLYSIVHL